MPRERACTRRCSCGGWSGRPCPCGAAQRQLQQPCGRQASAVSCGCPPARHREGHVLENELERLRVALQSGRRHGCALAGSCVLHGALKGAHRAGARGRRPQGRIAGLTRPRGSLQGRRQPRLCLALSAASEPAEGGLPAACALLLVCPVLPGLGSRCMRPGQSSRESVCLGPQDPAAFRGHDRQRLAT